MTPADIGARVLALALPIESARRLAPLGLLLAALLIVGAGWAGWRVFDHFNDRDAVRDAVNEANAEFAEGFSRASGRADVASQDRRAQFEARRRTTQELIDDALENGCAVGDYLASGGTVCVRGPADTVSTAGAE